MDLIKTHRLYSDGLNPQVVVSVPGIYRFLGAFATYYKGLIVFAPGEESMKIGLSLREDSTVCVVNCVSGEHKKYVQHSVKVKNEDRSGLIVKSIVEDFDEFCPNLSGLTATLDGELLYCDVIAWGASLSLGFTMALNRVLNTNLSKQKIMEIACRACSSWPDMESTLYCYTALEDNDNSLFYTVDLFCNKTECISNPLNDSDYSMIVVNSNIPLLALKEELEGKEKLAKSAFDEFKFKFAKSKFKDVVDSDIYLWSGEKSSENRLIVSYLYNEYKNSVYAKKALKAGDISSFGKALSKSWRETRDKLELACPEIDWLVKRFSEIQSCLGSGVIFNGYRSFVFLIINNNSVDQIKLKTEEYEHIFGFKSKFYKFTGSNRLSFLDVKDFSSEN